MLFDWLGWIVAPILPRAIIDSRLMNACFLQRQQPIARRDTAIAVDNDLGCIELDACCFKLETQLLWGQQRVICCEERSARHIQCSRDMSFATGPRGFTRKFF